MEHFGIGDPVARLNAFMAGDVDMMVNLPGKAVKEVEAAAGKEVWSVESGRYTSIVCHQGVSPSNNRDLIRAMQMCMDRTRVVKGELKGLGSVGNDQPINKAYYDYSHKDNLIWTKLSFTLKNQVLDQQLFLLLQQKSHKLQLFSV